MLVCWQYGGGLYIWGTATLTNTNVYANQAETVCSPFALNFRLAPRWNVTRAHDWQDGGGLYILYVSGNGLDSFRRVGTATLTNAKVYANLAGDVCSSFEHKLNDHPAPLKFYRSIIYAHTI